MKFIINHPNTCVVEATLNSDLTIWEFNDAIAKGIFNHIEYNLDIYEAAFHFAALTEEDHHVILNIINKNELYVVLAWFGLGLSFDQVKTLLGGIK